MGGKTQRETLPIPIPGVFLVLMPTNQHHSQQLRFSVIGLEHIHGEIMTQGLLDAGALLSHVFDDDPIKVAAFCRKFPRAEAALSEQQLLDDNSLHLIVSASIPNLRGPLSTRVLRSGKDFLSAKPPFTTLDQLDEARRVTKDTGRKFFVFYSERVHVRSALMAGEMINSGRLGKVVQVLCLAPHRLSRAARPDWFFDPEQSGGILCDIGSHQFEQILSYGGIQSATLNYAMTANRSVPEHPGFEDFGEASITGNNGVSGYIRVDWLTPDGLGVWGDVRTVILGTKGTLEIRKYTDVAREGTPDHLYLVDQDGEHHLRPDPAMPLTYFSELINDCLHRTETAMTQEHAFLAAELALQAQVEARKR